MCKPIKNRIGVLTVAVLFAVLLLVEFGVASSWKVAAAPPKTGTFHLKKYMGVNRSKEATGLRENTEDPSNLLHGKETVAGVVYEIYQTHKFTAEGLVELETGPAAVLDNGQNYKTDANGEINITDLPLGRYRFKEVSAPEGIQADTQEYYFLLPYTVGDETRLQYDVYVYPKNVWQTGSLSFTKVGDNGTDGLKNVRFAVFHEDGSAVKDTDGNDLTVTTRLSGLAAIEDLQVGTYYLLETENPDTEYLKSSAAKYWFEIYADSSNGVTSRSFYTDASMTTKVKDADGEDLKDGIIINYKTPTVVKTASAKSGKDIENNLVYVDSEGNLYANVDVPYIYTIMTTLPKNLAEYTRFEIYDAFAAGNIVLVSALSDIVPTAKGGASQPKLNAGEDFEVAREGNAGYRLKFTAKGIMALASAECTSVEVTFDAKIPEGHKVEGGIKKGENNDAAVDFGTNHSDPSVSDARNTVYPRAGEIVIHKVDSKDHSKLLAGANFSLRDSAGKEYWGSEHVSYRDVNGKSTGNVENAATFIFSQLPFGTYTLKETKAPSGYTGVSSSETIKLLPEKKDMMSTWISYEKYFENSKKTESETPDTSTPDTSTPDTSTPDTSSPGTSSGKSSPGPGNQKGSSSPKTGDQTNILLYVLGILSGCIIAVVLIYRKKRSLCSNQKAR